MNPKPFLISIVVLISLVILTSCTESDSIESGPDGSPLTPELSQLQFTYKGLSSGGGYYTEVAIYNDTYSDTVIFWINDGSDTPAIDPGPYSFDTGSAAPGTVTSVSFLVGYSVPIDYADWAATFDSRTSYEGRSGLSLNSHDQIESGSILVTSSGNSYSLIWNFTSVDGDTLSGSYSGIPSIIP